MDKGVGVGLPVKDGGEDVFFYLFIAMHEYEYFLEDFHQSLNFFRNQKYIIWKRKILAATNRFASCLHFSIERPPLDSRPDDSAC